MLGYLSKLLVFTIFSFFIAFLYYGYSFHVESFTGYTGYVVIIAIVYGIYKYLTTSLIREKEIKFSAFNIFSFFILNLLFLSFLFFSLNDSSAGYGFSLFFKILFYLSIPLFLILVNLSFGTKLLSKIKTFNNQSGIFKFISSIAFGFTLFVSLLSISSFFGLYNYISLFIILALIIFYSYKEILSYINDFFHKDIVTLENVDSSDKDKIKQFQKLSFLLSTEFLFIVITFLISVNFINIVRPMPIGWDDLGVYMNYPQLMAMGETSMMFSGFNSWQILTGIGFMFKSNVLAFFLNNIGSILASVFLILISSDFLKGLKKTFINIPLFITTIFLAMPMVIFQQAKDMKLDIGLFAFSIAGIYMFYYIFLKYIGYRDVNKISENKAKIIEEKGDEVLFYDCEEKTKKSGNEKLSIFSIFSYKFNNLGDSDLFKNKDYLLLLLISGIVIGFTFSIKVTSLMTILSLIGIIFYSKLGLSGLLGYFSLFVAVFTKFHLWDRLNVVYPKDDLSLISNVTFGALILSIIFFIYSFTKYKFDAIKKSFLLTFVFLAGIIFILSPWFAKNIYQSEGNISISSLLNGKGESIKVDFKNIYTESEINAIKNEIKGFGSLNDSGQTQNEDMGRYIGYGEGINNYVKLPYNLTMQVNQNGEFTDITFLYLALIPVILLFLSYSSAYLAFGTFAIIVLFSSLFFFIPSGTYLTNILGNITLPSGYSVILGLFLLPTIYFLYSLKKTKLSQLFRLNIVFTFIYVFLWTIAAYGIVWYGISMYFAFLIMIAIGAYYMSFYNSNDLEKNNLIRFLGSIILFIVLCIYIFMSVFPHGFKNLKGASYSNFKAGQVGQVVGIFETHPQYVSVLSELNLGDNAGKVFKNIISNYSEKVQSIISKSVTDYSDISAINRVFIQINGIKDEVGNTELKKIKKEIYNLKEELYYNILYPSKEIKNTAGIYRIGTFLKYFTSENYNRFYEDSLIVKFDNFIYDEDSSITVSRMKELGLKYFLVDLNAATIDKDPRHDLTRRYENLLDTFKSDELELVDSDSLCLKLGLDLYRQTGSEATYKTLAGVNYESYKFDENGDEIKINRGDKQLDCYNVVLELVQKGLISEKSYSYLGDINNYLLNNQELFSDKAELLNFMKKYVRHGWFVLFKIK